MSTPVPTQDHHNPPTVGLIANPLASKDIRRLVGLARVVALDGERRLIRNDNAYVDVAPGAFLLSVSKTLAANSQTGGKNSSFGPRTGGHHD